jgi:hypothetical protein
VLGWYRNGQPAVVAKAHGKGRAYLFGFLPGQAYLKSGLPIAPPDRGATDDANAHFLPTAMDVNLRARIVADFLRTANFRPVQCSVPLVETTCIDTPASQGKSARLAIPLMNFSGHPIAYLTVRIDGLAKAKSIRSVRRGTLQPTVEGDATIVTLPLDVADMFLIDR